MKVEDVEKKVEAIRRMARDNEAAHSMEDALYIKVLQEIVRQGLEPAGDASSPFALAQAALKAGRVDFDRWYT